LAHNPLVKNTQNCRYSGTMPIASGLSSSNEDLEPHQVTYTATKWDPVKIPDGLTCKNTFFDISTELESLTSPGPATCPPPTEGWWSSPMLRRGSSEGTSIDDMGPTPDWFGWEPATLNTANAIGTSRFEALLADAVGPDDQDDCLTSTCSVPSNPRLSNFSSTGSERTPNSPTREPARISMCSTVDSMLSMPKSVRPVIVELARELDLPPQQPTTSPAKPRRRRGSRAAKDPDRTGDECERLPVAIFIDLGGLQQVRQPKQASK